MSARRTVSVVIPTRDKPFHLGVVLHALAPQVDDGVEVVIVFDGCKPRIFDAVNQLNLPFSPLLVINPVTLGRARSRNLGIRNASGEIIIFMDDDAIPCSGFIKKHRDAHKQHCILQGELKSLSGKHGVIANLYPWKEEHLQSSLFKKADNFFLSRFMILLKKLLGRVVNKTSFTTRNASVLKKDLESVGLFDEKFDGWGYEDVDLGYRLCERGIPFVRDFTLHSYHIPHPVNHGSKDREEQKNIRYFLSKIRGDCRSSLVTILYFYGRKLIHKLNRLV